MGALGPISRKCFHGASMSWKTYRSNYFFGEKIRRIFRLYSYICVILISIFCSSLKHCVCLYMSLTFISQKLLSALTHTHSLCICFTVVTSGHSGLYLSVVIIISPHEAVCCTNPWHRVKAEEHCLVRGLFQVQQSEIKPWLGIITSHPF